MTSGGRTAGTRRPRADAQRNQSLVLVAARDVFVERGADAPLEEVARRAGVGIATLYRNFADRNALLRAVVLQALQLTREVAERSLAEHPDPFDALTAYMHQLIELRVAAVIPVALDHSDLDDAEISAARDDSTKAVQRIIDSAHATGALPTDITFADIGMLLVRLSRPLPGFLPPGLDNQLAHRHLSLLLQGMRPSPGRPQLPGPALTREQLRSEANRE